MRSATRVAAAFFFVLAIIVCPAQSPLPSLEKFHRVVFIGDSITYYGGYVDDIEAYVLTRDTNSTLTILNLGQSSETVSGLSEPNHAGGKYTRPDLHTRLAAILEKTKPDLVIADYGMNDGIYQPFDEGRAQKFEDGMRWLHETVLISGAQIVHVTPSPFDPQRIKAKLSPDGAKGFSSPYTNYNDTLDRYSEWLVAQRANGWDVVDIHSPMNAFLASHRQSNPDFALSRDGVHPTATGHWLMAREILVHWGAPKEIGTMDDVSQMLAVHPQGREILQTITQQEHLLRDAWLTDTGHLRPGHPTGLPLPEAEKQAAVLADKIHSLIQAPTAK
jgi:lysophospholipase L1-like esterase